MYSGVPNTRTYTVANSRTEWKNGDLLIIVQGLIGVQGGNLLEFDIRVQIFNNRTGCSFGKWLFFIRSRKSKIRIGK